MSKKTAIFGLVLALSSERVVCQALNKPAAQLKSAAQLVAEYSNTEGDPVVRTLFWRGCPRDDARRDSIFVGLLKLPPTGRLVSDVSLYWHGGILLCKDTRLDSWLRAQSAVARDPIVLMRLTRGLLIANPTPENIAAVKRISADTNLSDELRTSVLEVYVHEHAKLNARQRVEQLAELYSTSGRIPEPFHSNEVFFIKSTPEVGYWRTRMLTTLVQNPQAPGAIELLQHLGGDAIFEAGARDTAWVARFNRAMLTLDGDPRSPASLKAGVAKTRTLLRRKN